MHIIILKICPTCGSMRLSTPLKNVAYFRGSRIGTPIKNQRQCLDCGEVTSLEALVSKEVEVSDDQRTCPECGSPHIRKTNVFSDGIPFWACTCCQHSAYLNKFHTFRERQEEAERGKFEQQCSCGSGKRFKNCHGLIE